MHDLHLMALYFVGVKHPSLITVPVVRDG